MSKDNYLEDINLWKRLINDDREALSLLFRKYYKPLLNYGLQLIPRDDLVKDSIQELFLTIWDKRDRLADVQYVRPYLYSSLRRSVFRQAERMRTWQDRDQLYSDETIDQREISIEQQMIFEETQSEKRKKLEEAFESLNGHQKEAAFLKFYNGLSNDEISDIMGVKKESVYNYIYRAIFSLKESIKISLTG